MVHCNDDWFSDDHSFIYHYDSDGQRVESPGQEADAPMILYKDGLTAKSASEFDANTIPSASETPENDGSWRGRYVFTGQEIDVDHNLQHHPMHGVPDLTPGRFLEESD